MLESLHIRGYRSLRDVILPLPPLTVVTGGNGTGKSNLYRCLHPLGRAARGEFSRALANQGGMPSALWVGTRRSASRQPARATFSIEVRATPSATPSPADSPSRRWPPPPRLRSSTAIPR